MDRRVPPPFPNTPDYANHSAKILDYLNQSGKTLPKELVSPRYRVYPPLEMFSFPQAPINQDGPPNQQQPIPAQRSRPGFLRRADSLVSSTELALFRRVHEAQQEALQEAQYRQQVCIQARFMLIKKRLFNWTVPITFFDRWDQKAFYGTRDSFCNVLFSVYR